MSSMSNSTKNEKRSIDYLKREKQELSYTLYHDFVNGLHKTSIYKSIRLVNIEGSKAIYECEPYDEAYRTNTDEQFNETCYKIMRAFKRYYKDVFERYDVTNIEVSIFDEYSVAASINVYEDGQVEGWNF